MPMVPTTSSSQNRIETANPILNSVFSCPYSSRRGAAVAPSVVDMVVPPQRGILARVLAQQPGAHDQPGQTEQRIRQRIAAAKRERQDEHRRSHHHAQDGEEKATAERL